MSLSPVALLLVLFMPLEACSQQFAGMASQSGSDYPDHSCMYAGTLYSPGAEICVVGTPQNAKTIFCTSDPANLEVKRTGRSAWAEGGHVCR